MKIFDILSNTVEEKSPNTTLRIAGGWVRDRALNLKSKDIDIAVDNMSGLEFAKLVHAYMKENNIECGQNVATIAANTEANKNLESAILRIGNPDCSKEEAEEHIKSYASLYSSSTNPTIS